VAKEERVPEVRLERKLQVPADSASQALGELLQAIERQEGPWRGFALHVGFGDLHLPDVGYVAVPIRLTVEKDAKEARAFDIRFNAANLPDVFPGFTGTMRVEPGELGQCELYLSGEYELPMQFFGKLLDGALMPNVAAVSLENFIDEIAAACQARVDQREAEFVRYHFSR
jgi:hypothetical protein